jgi:hypothetical protein
MSEEASSEATKPEVRELSSIDQVLLENLALAEENVALRHQIAEAKIREKKMTVRAHLIQRFKIDINKFDFSADTKSGKIVIVPKKNGT